MKHKNVNTRNRLKNRDEVSGPLCILTDNILKGISTPCNKVRDIYCTTSIVIRRSALRTTPYPKRLLGQKPPPLHISMTIVHKREKIPVSPSRLNQQGLLKRCLRRGRWARCFLFPRATQNQPRKGKGRDDERGRGGKGRPSSPPQDVLLHLWAAKANITAY